MNDIKIADLLGLGSASAFLVTIVYLYGYSFSLGVNLFLYFSTTDYFRLAIQWLPPVIASAVGGSLLDKFFTRVERGATEEEIAARSGNPSRTRRFRAIGNAAPAVAVVLVALFTIFLGHMVPSQKHGVTPPGQKYVMWGALCALIWLVLVRWYAREPRLAGHWTPSWRYFVGMFPALVIVALFYGLYSGESGTRMYLDPGDARIALKDQAAPIAGRVLFALDTYLVVRDQQSRHVIVIPTAEVTRIVHERRN
jgi:hypothetical protein